MAQTIPMYPYATGKSETPILDELVRKYGFSNISWPIALIEEDRTIAYLYEMNAKNKINLLMDSRPGSRSKLPSYYLNFMSNPRFIFPRAEFLAPLIQGQYSCSYEAILESSHYSTVDLDYVWYRGSSFRGFELTTFYMEFTSHDRARTLISQIRKRPSWQGPEGAHAFHKIVDSAQDLGVEYYVVCANTTSKVGSDLKTDGNVCLFPLNHEQVALLQAGKAPNDTRFMKFQEFLAWL